MFLDVVELNISTESEVMVSNVEAVLLHKHELSETS